MNQTDKILRFMKDHGSITQLDAAGFGCMRLAARIMDLKSDGHLISKKMRHGKNRYGESVSFAEYFLEDTNE